MNDHDLNRLLLMTEDRETVPELSAHDLRKRPPLETLSEWEDSVSDVWYASIATCGTELELTNSETSRIRQLAYVFYQKGRSDEGMFNAEQPQEGGDAA